MSALLITELKGRMDKSIKAFQYDLSKIRTGRASLNILDDIKIDYYGTKTPLQQMAALSVPDAKTIMISPWDAKAITEIERTIQKSDLGLNPINDGKVIRLPIPPMTEERRKEFVKMVKKMGEESKVAIRQIRREAMDLLKKKEKEENASKDDVKILSEEVEKVTHQYVEKVDQILELKEKDLMQV